MPAADGDEPVYVLGEAWARARHADDELAAPGSSGPGVVGAGLRYDLDAAGDDLFDPVENEIDRKLRAAVRRFGRSAPEVRSKLRDATRMDDFYTLLHSPLRSADRSGAAERPLDASTRARDKERDHLFLEMTRTDDADTMARARAHRRLFFIRRSAGVR